MKHDILHRPRKQRARALLMAGAVLTAGSLAAYAPARPAADAGASPAAGAVARPVGDSSGASAAAAKAEVALAALASDVASRSSEDALRTAFRAYFSYREAHAAEVRKPYLYFVDLGLSNATPRGWVFDMDSLAVVDGPFMVAHGRGSGPRNGTPTTFSNAAGTYASSLGLYLAQETYTFTGKSGGRRYASTGLKLRGESGGFNGAARARGVVAHGAPYVTGREAGRSEGCPAMEVARASRLLPMLANGGVVFLYSPRDARWLAEDPWIHGADPVQDARFTYDQGGITRGARDRKELALIFTGGDFAEGATAILDALRERGVKASFFVTGGFTRHPEFDGYLRRMVADGHYLGAHSDAHLLYAPWEDRSRTLVTQDSFRADLEQNLAALARYGPQRADMRFFIPPYEWYNQQIADWAKDMGLVLFNYSPGTRSNADYMPDREPRFISSQAIYDGILDYEATHADGLNGFLLLLHVGAGDGRTDKMHRFVGPLVDELTRRGYRFVRVDQLLAAALH